MVWTVKVWLLTPAAKVRVPVRAVKSPTSALSPRARLVAKSMLWLTSEAPVRVTVKVIRPPSLTETSATLKAGRSSSRMAGSVLPGWLLPPVPSSLMVATPWASPMVALEAEERLTLKDSLPSKRLSLLIATAIILVVSPAAKDSVPALPVKSLAAPAVAVPSANA